MTPYLSVIIPAYNEGEAIETVLERLGSEFSVMGRPVEIVVVDDGSSDDTYEKVERIASGNALITLLGLSRNFGHQNAILAGLSVAAGDYVAVMDADLQDPPAVLLEMLRKAEMGYDVVYGVRRSRRESLAKRVCYWAFYRLLRAASEDEIPLDSGDFCVMTRRVAEQVVALPERGPFVRGLRAWVGFKQAGYPYDRPERSAGQTKYTAGRLVRLAAGGFLSSSRLPLKLSIYLGLLLSFLGFAWAAKIIAYKLLDLGDAPQGFSAIMVAILVIGGSQLVATGVVGYYLGRVLDQVERRPNYIVARSVNSRRE